jgi:hypothetical protein
MKQLIFLLLLIFLPVSQWAQESPKSIFEMMQREDYLSLNLELDFKYLQRNKKEKEYKPAKLSFTDQNGLLQNFDIEIRTRGNMRLQVCDLPPLKVKFSQKELAAKGLNDQNNLKMVIICSNSKPFEQFLLREYVVYRLYNIISEFSLRVQLAKVKYSDSSGGFTPMESFAILIEDDEEFALRHDAKTIQSTIASSKILNTDFTETMSIFQYMIGNTDWQIYNRHNIVLIGKTGTSVPIPIPYDFDYSAIVGTPYAAPNDQIPIKHVSERYYQGFCRSQEETLKTIQLFLDKKQEIFRYCEQFSHFNNQSKSLVYKYLESFYRIAEDPKKVKREILNHCDQWLKPLGN